MRHIKKFESYKPNQQYIIDDYSDEIQTWLNHYDDRIDSWINSLEDLSDIVSDFKDNDIDLSQEYSVTVGNEDGIKFLSRIVKGEVDLDSIINGLRSIKGDE